MKRSTLARSFVFGLVVASSAAACTPTPEKVCAHLKEVIKDKDMQDTAQCTTMMTAMKGMLGDKWKPTAKCLMDAKDENSAEKCMESAGVK
jgi:hypothetical protein